MKDAVVGFTAIVVFRFIRRMLLMMPDSCLTGMVSIIHRLILKTTGDAEAAAPLAELRDIFQCGPPVTDTIRKIAREADPDWVKSTARCLARPGPYGID